MGIFQQTRGVRRAAPKAGKAAAEVFAALAKSTRYAEPGLVENWPTIAGRKTAEIARPGRVTGGPKDRTLEVVVRDGAAAAQMQMRADALITAVNRYLGPGSIGRIAIRQIGAAARPEAAAGPGIGDDSPLGAALSSFRAAVRAKNPGK